MEDQFETNEEKKPEGGCNCGGKEKPTGSCKGGCSCQNKEIKRASQELVDLLKIDLF